MNGTTSANCWRSRPIAATHADAIEDQIFSEKYLLERPLLAAIRRDKPPVLLIDEIDRADDEFEAFLLELLSDFQVSIPELGTISATTIPHVVLTSNGTRELSDALRRRCLYHYVDYPDVDREARIIMARINGAGASLSLQIARMVETIRKEELRKVPGVAETLDWAAALVGIDVRDLHDAPETVHETLMCLLKTHEDQSRADARGDANGCWGRSHELLRHQSRTMRRSTRSRASSRPSSRRFSGRCATTASRSGCRRARTRRR